MRDLSNNNSEDDEEKVIEGIILDVDYGFGMKFKEFDGFDCVQLFGNDDIAKLLLQYKGDYRGEISCNTLKHRRIYLLASDMTNGIPNAVAKLPPSKYPQYSWIYNQNWD